MPVLPEMSGQTQVIMNIEDQEAIPVLAADAMVDNDVRLTLNQKLRISHKGVVEVPRTYQSSETWEETTVTSYGVVTTGLAYVGPNTQPIPFSDIRPDGLYIDEYGSSSSVSERDLVEANAALEADNAVAIINDLPGRTGGVDMTAENYLTYSGAGRDIPGAPEVSSSSS